MVWREPSNHSNDCYFCLTSPVASGMNRKKKQRIDYSNIPSAIRPLPHGEDLPVPEPPIEYHLNSEMEEEDTDLMNKNLQIQTSKVQHLSHLLELPKVKAELLASRTKQWKYLDEGMKITLYCYRQTNLDLFFTMEGILVACKDVSGLFKALNMSHCPDEWRLFIDSSKVSLIAVLLHLPLLLHMHLELKKVMIP